MNKILSFIITIIIALGFAFLMRMVFGIDGLHALYSVMSLTFLFLLPFGVGFLTIYLSRRDISKLSYRFFIPWIPIVIFFVLTLAFTLEGMACWIMVLPLFLIASSLGGLTAGYFKLRKKDKNKDVYISIVVILPFLLSPIEQMIGAIAGTYKAYTYIDIEASKKAIWQNVTRVKEIDVKQDKGGFTSVLGFPRPVKAELNFEGVGAYRKAIFSKGLVFHEEVKEYDHQKRMVFSIKAYPHEIPSATMDKHVVIGGDYFDVLDGTYELERLAQNKYRLHLYSHFKLTTTFNFYASYWARWIMKDIQNNILQIIRLRAEKEKIQKSEDLSQK